MKTKLFIALALLVLGFSQAWAASATILLKYEQDSPGKPGQPHAIISVVNAQSVEQASTEVLNLCTQLVQEYGLRANLCRTSTFFQTNYGLVAFSVRKTPYPWFSYMADQNWPIAKDWAIEGCSKAGSREHGTSSSACALIDFRVIDCIYDANATLTSRKAIGGETVEDVCAVDDKQLKKYVVKVNWDGSVEHLL